MSRSLCCACVRETCGSGVSPVPMRDLPPPVKYRAVDSPMALPSGRSKSIWEYPFPLVCSPTTAAPALS